jgi:hypothetical protein
MSSLCRTNTSLRYAICAGMLLAHASVARAADTTPPESGITQPLAGASVAAPVAVNGTAADDVAVNFAWLTIRDLGTGSYWRDGTWSAGYQQQRVAVAPAGGKATTWNYEFQEGINRGTGAYRVSVGAVDAAGNLDATKATVDFAVATGAATDGVTPATSITTPVQAANLHAPVAAAGMATANVGVDFVWITARDLGTLSRWTGTGWSAAYVRVHVPVAAPGAASTTWSYDFDPSGSGGSGTYQLFAKAQDTSGNVDPSAAQVWFNATDNGSSADLPPVADAGPDRAIVDVDASGAEPVTLSAARSSDPDGVVMSVDWSENGVLLGSGTEATLTLPAATHVIDVKVTDDDGNTHRVCCGRGV